jgi:hypothetical protein
MDERDKAEEQRRFEHAAANMRLEHEPNELLSQTQKRIREQDANRRLDQFLEVMDKSQPGMKREAVPLAFDDEGKPVWGVIRWTKP